MSVVKSKRKESDLEVFTYFNKLRKSITDLLLVDFGYNIDKTREYLDKKFYGKTYYDLTIEEQEKYEKTYRKRLGFDTWFIESQREAVIECLRNINKELYIANNIYPTCILELEERRKHQDSAIGYCYYLLQELQYTIETIPVNINKYMPFAEGIDREISLIKAWRKSDNRFKKILLSNENNTDDEVRPFNN